MKKIAERGPHWDQDFRACVQGMLSARRPEFSSELPEIARDAAKMADAMQDVREAAVAP